MIYTEKLTKRYGELVALRDLNLTVEKGEVFGLIGPNGAGKTTTLKILATLLHPTHGRVEVCGLRLDRDAAKIRQLIGYMPDFAGVYEDMRVDEYLYFFAAAARITGKKAEAMVRDVLELTDLTSKREFLVEALSRGMRQRLGLARVLLHDPKVLLLDEPASGLDPRARVEIRMLLKELCAMDKTVIISSHILSELAELCTTVGIIEKGQLLYKASVQEIMRKGKRGNVLHVRVGSPLPADTRLEEITATSENEPEAAADQAPTSEDTEPKTPAEETVASAETIRAKEALDQDPRVEETRILSDTIEVRLGPDTGDPSFVARLLVGKGFHLHHFSEEPLTLEDAFMRLTDGVVS